MARDRGGTGFGATRTSQQNHLAWAMEGNSSLESLRPTGGGGGRLDLHPLHPSHCLQEKLSCFGTAVGTHITPTSGFVVFLISRRQPFPQQTKIICLASPGPERDHWRLGGGAPREWGSEGLSVAQAGKPGPASRKALLLGKEGGRTGWTQPPAWGVQTLPLATTQATGSGWRERVWGKTPGPPFLRGGALGEWHIRLVQRPHSVVGRASVSLEKQEDLYSKLQRTKGRRLGWPEGRGSRELQPALCWTRREVHKHPKLLPRRAGSGAGRGWHVNLSLSTLQGMHTGERGFHGARLPHLHLMHSPHLDCKGHRPHRWEPGCAGK